MSDFSQLLTQSIKIILDLQSNYIDIILVSLNVSLSAVIISAAVCIPLAAIISINNFYFKNFLIILINTLLALPPVVIGLIIYILLSRFGLFGKYDLLYTVSAMIIAQVILISPILLSLVKETIDDYYNQYKEYLDSVYASKFKKMITLIWEAKVNLFVHILISLGRALSEVGAILIVGGNIENITRTMTTGIVLETSKGELSIALSLGITLLLISLFINIILYIIKRKIMVHNG